MRDRKPLLKGATHKQSQLQKRILERIDENRDEMTKFLQELIRIPSVVGHEGDAQKFMEKTFRDLELEVDVWEPNVAELRKHPAFFETTSYTKFGYEGRPNVIGKLRGSGRGRSLILAGHIDVVSPEPVKAWTYNPWGGKIVDNKLYGRGAADMKGGIASMVYALKCVQETGIKLKGDVTLESTIEEEDGGIGGTLATILKGYSADATIITEPTDVYTIGIASAGAMYFRVKVIGKPAHAAYAHLGVNAIGKAIKIYNALSELNKKRQAKISYPPAEIYPEMKGHATTINIGKISGGDWPSTVAGWCELECRIGWPPGEELEEIKEQIEHTIETAAKRDPWLRKNLPDIEWFGWRAEPHEQNVNHPIVQTVANFVKEVTGKEPMFEGGSAGLDTRFFVRYANVPAITFGPRGFNLHSTDEYVEIDSLVETARILALTIVEWCRY
ncbi:MAG: ArgE/DapE family deacylase [Candidatus Bathyarchaeaceae archaeon]